MAKDPFPNNWGYISKLSDDEIDSTPFKEVMGDIATWHLPEPYCCVVRVYNRKDKRLREYAYKLQSKAHQRIKEAADAGYEVTVLTDDIIGAINYPDD